MDVEHPLEEFLLAHFEVEDVSEIDPFKGYRGETWAVARETTLMVDVKLDTTCPKITLGDKDPSHIRPSFVSGTEEILKESDLHRVCVTDIICTHKKNTGNTEFLIKPTFKHRGFSDSKLSEMTKAATFNEHAGDAFMSIAPQSDKDCNHVALRSLDFGKTEKEYIKCNAFLNEYNLLNGILKLEKPMWTGDLPDSVSFFIRKQLNGEMLVHEHFHEPEVYYAVPARHVLSWPLTHNDTVRRERGIAAFEMRTKNREILFYFVADVCFEHILQSYMVLLGNQVDVRPLGEFGFQAVPKDATQCDESAVLVMKVNMKFIVFPKLSDEDIKNLRPTLSPNYKRIELFYQEQQLSSHVLK